MAVPDVPDARIIIYPYLNLTHTIQPVILGYVASAVPYHSL